MVAKKPIPEGLPRPSVSDFYAGLHRPVKGASPGIHAVSKGVTDGARRSVCGLISRFISIEWGGAWTPFADARGEVCGKCIEMLGDESAVKARGFGDAA